MDKCESLMPRNSVKARRGILTSVALRFLHADEVIIACQLRVKHILSSLGGHCADMIALFFNKTATLAKTAVCKHKYYGERFQGMHTVRWAQHICNEEGGGAVLEDSVGILRLDPISSVYCGDCLAS